MAGLNNILLSLLECLAMSVLIMLNNKSSEKYLSVSLDCSASSQSRSITGCVLLPVLPR